MPFLQTLDPCRHIEPPDRGQGQAAIVAPGEEPGAGAGISPAGVGIADIGGVLSVDQP
jgi:hypothetical protein